MVNHMVVKAQLCYKKAKFIFKGHPRAVGDCVYSKALLFKHHMKLAKVRFIKTHPSSLVTSSLQRESSDLQRRDRL